ncbi:MAG: type II secretion system minor pseudopilin GspK [Nitrospinota bacterium]
MPGQLKGITGNERGIALLLTLFVTLFLAVIVIEGFTTAFVDLSISGNFRDGLKASYIARAGIDAARGILQEDNRRRKTKKYDSLDEPWALLKGNIFPFPVGDGGVRVEIYDEGGKINLNSLVQCQQPKKCRKNEHYYVNIVKNFFTENDIDPNLIDALIDWMDADDQLQPYGAEKEHYLSLTPPYEPRNDRILTLRELLLVDGIDRETYDKMLPYVTVYGGITIGQAGNPEGRININTASVEVLRALSEDMTEELSQKVIDYREKNPFQKTESLKTPTGLSYPLDFGNDITVKSTYFTIISTGAVNDVTRVEKVVVKRDGLNVKIAYWWPE